MGMTMEHNDERMATMHAVVYIGDRLKNLRMRRALTQQELAEKAGVSQNTIARIERNKAEPHMRTIRKLAKASMWTPPNS